VLGAFSNSHMSTERRRSLMQSVTNYAKSPGKPTDIKQAENVQVVVRCRYRTLLKLVHTFLTWRPLNQQETKDKVQVICKVEEKKKEVVVSMKSSNQAKTFSFDAAYGPSSTQAEIFEVCSGIPDRVLLLILRVRCNQLWMKLWKVIIVQFLPMVKYVFDSTYFIALIC
jgi:hypothetical protein